MPDFVEFGQGVASMSPAVVAFALGEISDSSAAQRTTLKALEACPNV